MSRHNIAPASVRSGKITLDIDWMGLPVGHGELFQTESLPAAGYLWKVEIYRDGFTDVSQEDNVEASENVAIYLKLCEDCSENCDTSINCSFAIRIVNHKDRLLDHCLEDQAMFGRQKVWGSNTFAKRDDMNADTGFLSGRGKALLEVDMAVYGKLQQTRLDDLAASTAESCDCPVLSMSPAENLKRDLGLLLTSGTDSDMTVHVAVQTGTSRSSSTFVNGKVVFAFKVHSWLMKLRSPYFRAMLTRWSTDEMSYTEVDVEPSVFEEVLSYIYTYALSSASALETMGEQLLLAASKYDISGLRDKAEASLVRTLSIENVAARLLLADRTPCANLLRASTDFMVEHGPAVADTASWRDTEATLSQGLCEENAAWCLALAHCCGVAPGLKAASLCFIAEGGPSRIQAVMASKGWASVVEGGECAGGGSALLVAEVLAATAAATPVPPTLLSAHFEPPSPNKDATVVANSEKDEGVHSVAVSATTQKRPASVDTDLGGALKKPSTFISGGQ